MADTDAHSDLLTVAEAAVRLHKSERTIRRWIASGRLPVVEISGQVMVQLAGFDTAADAPTARVNAPAESLVRDRLEEVLREQIRRLEAENDRLWTMLRSALPGVAKPEAGIPWWAIAALVVLPAGAAIAVYFVR